MPKKNPKHIVSKFNDRQKFGASLLASLCKDVTVISDDQFNEEVVGYIAMCKHCGKLNQYKIISEVLFSKKELMCEHCKAMYPINPIPAMIDDEGFEAKIDELMRNERK